MKKLILIVYLLFFVACSSTPSYTTQTKLVKINSFYREWKGIRYRYGGNSKSGIDCSALMQRLYNEKFNKNIGRTTLVQAKKGRRVSKLSQLRVGDLVFFKTGKSQRHVGVYIGKSEFVHASTSKGVMKSSLKTRYWKNRFWLGRRIV